MRLVLLCFLAALATLTAADWPQYRHDARRSGVATTGVSDPTALALAWVRQLPPRTGIFSHDGNTFVDRGHLPVAAGGRIYYGTEADQAVVCLDAASGDEQWRRFLDGAVRFAPVVAEGLVVVGADDGRLHAFDATTGAVRWVHDGRPDERQVIHHGRVASAWPVSGGPVFDAERGLIHYATGIWPIDGILNHGVHLADGSTAYRTARWDRPSIGHQALLGDQVVRPIGLGHPLRFDAATGAYRGAGGGSPNMEYNSEVVTAADGAWYVSGSYTYRSGDGRQLYRCYANAEHRVRAWPPIVPADGRIIGINDGILKVFRLPVVEPGSKKKPKKLVQDGAWWFHGRPDFKWSQTGTELAMPAEHGLAADWYPHFLAAMAGDQLYAVGDGAVVVLRWSEGAEPEVVRVLHLQAPDEVVACVLIADDRVLIATNSQRLYAFAPGAPGAAEPRRRERPAAITSVAWDPAVDPAIASGGYAFLFGPTGDLGADLAQRGMRSVVWAGAGAAEERQRYAAHLAERLAVLGHDWRTTTLPRWAAALMVSNEPIGDTATTARILRRCLRPYGGRALLPLAAGNQDALAALLGDGFALAPTQTPGWILVNRAGPPPGADDWTHELHDPGNRLASRDALTGPFGVLWTGGPGAEFERNYESHVPPGPLVVEGRYLIQGKHHLTALDCYTGRLLWEYELPEIQKYATPYGREAGAYPTPAANVMPLAWRSRTTGLNVVALADETYIVAGAEVLVLDTASGRQRRRIPLPELGQSDLKWGTVRAIGDLLVATAFHPDDDVATWSAWANNNEKEKDRIPQRFIFAIDRATGELRWHRSARVGFLNRGIAIGNGRVLVVDHVLPAFATLLDRVAPASVLSLDLASGQEQWQVPLDVSVSNVAYHADQDLLVLPSRHGWRWNGEAWVQDLSPDDPKARQAKPTPIARLLALRGQDGASAWRIEDPWASEPVMLTSTLVVTRHGATFELATGRRHQRPQTVSAVPAAWHVPRGGCNFLVGSDHLATWRTAYYDFDHLSGAYAIPGMRSGCTPSMLPAAGVLSHLSLAHGPEQPLRTAMVLQAMPEQVNWGDQRLPNEPPQVVTDLALNLGAWGSTVDAGGRRWLPLVPMSSQERRRIRGQPFVEALGEALEVVRQHPLEVAAERADLASCGLAGVEAITIQLPAVADGTPAPAYTLRLQARPGDERTAIIHLGEAVVGTIGGATPLVETTAQALAGPTTVRVAVADGQAPPVLVALEVVRE